MSITSRSPQIAGLAKKSPSTTSSSSVSSSYDQDDDEGFTLEPQTNLRLQDEKDEDKNHHHHLPPPSLIASSRVSGSRRSRSRSSTKNDANNNETDVSKRQQEEQLQNNSRRVTFDAVAMKASTTHKTLGNINRTNINNNGGNIIYVGDGSSSNNNMNFYSPKPKTPTKSMTFQEEEEETEGGEDSSSQIAVATPPSSQQENQKDSAAVSSPIPSGGFFQLISGFTNSVKNFVSLRFSSNSTTTTDITEEKSNFANNENNNNNNNNNNPYNLKFLNAVRKPVRRERNNNGNSTSQNFTSQTEEEIISNNASASLFMRRKSNNNTASTLTVGWDDPLYTTRKQCCSNHQIAASSQRNNNNNKNNSMKNQMIAGNNDGNDDDDDNENHFVDLSMVHPSRLTKTPLFSAQILSGKNTSKAQQREAALASFNLDRQQQQPQMNSSSNNNNNNNSTEQISKKDSTTTTTTTSSKKIAPDPNLLVQLLENEHILVGLLEKIAATAAKRAVKQQVESSSEAVNRVVHSVVRRIVVDEIHNASVRPVLSLVQRVEQNTASRDFARSDLNMQTNSEKTEVSALVKILKPAGTNEEFKIGSKIAGYQMTARDFASLRPGHWLTDMIVNCYISLALSPEHMHYRRSSLRDSVTSAVLLNSHFYATLRDRGYEDAKRMTLDDDIFAARLVVVPINDNNVHWTLLTVDVAERRFCFWDSMGSDGRVHVARIRSFFQRAWDEKQNMRTNVTPVLAMSVQEIENIRTATTKKARRQRMDLLTPLPLSPPSEWAVFAPKKTSPQQQGGVDCGVFTCQTAVHLIWGTSIWESLKLDWITNLREIMAVELSTGMMVPRC